MEASEANAPKEIVLSITYNQDGTISVNGPVADKVLCYGLLSAAKDAIFDHHMALMQNGKKNTGVHRIINFARGR